MSRWIRFIISIIFGLGLGLTYGWILIPPGDLSSTPETLRIDYKTDYVLMVAEFFQSDADIQAALQRLVLLGDSEPDNQIQEVILFAQKVGYSETDIAKIQELLRVIQSRMSDNGGIAP